MSRSLCSSADCVIFNQRVLDAGQGGALADLARNAPNAQFTELRGISELYVMAFLPCHERAGLVKCGSCCGCLGGSWSVLGAFWGLLGAPWASWGAKCETVAALVGFWVAQRRDVLRGSE